MKTSEDTAPPRRKRSLFKGFLAGAIGGLVGAAAKAAGEAAYPPRTLGQIPPPAVLVNRMSAHPLSEEAEVASVRAIHWGFGALAGGVYGALAEYQPVVTGRLGPYLRLDSMRHHACIRLAHDGVDGERRKTSPRANTPARWLPMQSTGSPRK